MSAQIVTFPMPRSGMRRPEVLTREVHHLDLAALKLKDRGWAAKAGVISEKNYRIETPVLSTNAPDIEVTAALVHAYDDLCGFLVEVFETLGSIALSQKRSPHNVSYLSRLGRTNWRLVL